MLESLLNRNHDHRRGLLAVHSKALLQVGIDAHLGPAVNPISFVRAGNKEDQRNAWVLDQVFDAVYAIVAAPIGDQQSATVILHLDEARLVAFG